jgi:hypothetical protein
MMMARFRLAERGSGQPAIGRFPGLAWTHTVRSKKVFMTAVTVPQLIGVAKM